MVTKSLTINASNAELEQILVNQIDRNPNNPRIVFRQEEMDDLMDSIHRWGVQVPVSVYRKAGRFVLIDGERRWRCALKLNLKRIPALVHDEPSQLTNMLLMFNIHALREQWDLLTIALKLQEIIDLLENEGQDTTERALSAATGLTQGVIRRCRYLLNLPTKYHEMILKELAKPKSHQKFTEDFFIEMERALRTVERAMPDLMEDKEQVRTVLIGKFRDDVIDNRVHLRQVAKIARAEAIHSDPDRAEKALRRLFTKNQYSIEQAYEDSVSTDYEEREVLQRLESLIDRLRELPPEAVDEPVKEQLRELIRVANRLLKG